LEWRKEEEEAWGGLGLVKEEERPLGARRDLRAPLGGGGQRERREGNGNGKTRGLLLAAAGSVIGHYYEREDDGYTGIKHS
jgi:hypothetical protein